MKFVAAKCPTCQGELQVPEDKDFVKCMYCGVEVKVREAIKISIEANLPNLIELANSSLNSENYEESYNYFNKILEFDIKNHEAWFGKAVSASMLSTLANPRHKEMMNYFENTVKYYNKEDIENYKAQISGIIFDYCKSFFELAENHKDEFISVNSTWPEYISYCWDIIGILEYTFLKYDSNNEILLKSIISICEDNLNGTVFNEEVWVGNDYKEVQRTKKVSNNHMVELVKKIQETKIKWRRIDPIFWKKHDEWIEETGKIKSKNQTTLILVITISFIIGYILYQIFGKEKHLFFFILLTEGIGIFYAMLTRKPLPKEPKELENNDLLEDEEEEH